MTIVYFVIAAIALAGAVALLWLDRRRSSVTRHQRAIWGDEHDFKFRETDTKLRTVFRRATMNVPDTVTVENVAYGHYGGAEAVVFDLSETASVIAVRRSTPSAVVVDLRHEDVLAPAEEDVELLGAMGPRVMFSNNLDVARRVCDRRMVALANKAPAYVEVLWNEGNWALGSLPLTDDAAELDTGLEVVRRFADLLRVLPPLREPQDAPDPRDPHGPTRAELADEKTENMRDKNRRARVEAAARDRAERDDVDSAAAVPTALHKPGEVAPRPRRAAPPAEGHLAPADPRPAGRPMAQMPMRGKATRPPELDDDVDFDDDFEPPTRQARTGPGDTPSRRNRHRRN
ncbi:hypothetical protein EF294_20290 [Gordonia oryzae]|uniref:Secreted protein n=1 Tax=Gordonia oryzae TaxID=2487349 RepID=A0A3N4GD61_9ACTN|nr:hypothetical protein [Gordonia oryzae]RPA56921.1 hypothetical protein EF294_20290 [Gordonia oryzae]